MMQTTPLAASKATPTLANTAPPRITLPPRSPLDSRYPGLRYERHATDDFFAGQRCRSEDLPPPQVFLRNLAHCVIEIISGVRNLNQIGRWVSEEVYLLMNKRVVIAERARRAKNLMATHPQFSIGNIHCCEPCDGVVEASVMVHGRGRTRAIAIRIEGLDNRWKATALHVL